MSKRHLVRSRWPRLALIASIVSFGVSVGVPASAAGTSSPYLQWPMGGQNYQNTRYNAAETTLSTSNIASLATKWTFTTHGDVSATAAVVNGVAYFPDFGGYLNAVNLSDGSLLWQVPIYQYEQQGGFLSGKYVHTMQANGGILHSRTSPAYDPSTNTLYVGDQGTGYVSNGTVISPPSGSGTGDHLFAIDANTGAFKWGIQLESQVAAIDTQSPIVYNGTVYVGSASNEEAFAAESSTYQCCTFRGSLDAISTQTHKLLWQTYMMSAADVAARYSGAAVWGSTPAIDALHNEVVIGTGNNYTQPTTCDQCVSPADDHFDSVVGLNLQTGNVDWYMGTREADNWNASCIAFIFPNGYTGNCPQGNAPDYDFGSGPMITTATVNGLSQEVVIAGQKSGAVWEIPAGGSGSVTPVWGSQVGPGSTLGGIEWGSATDGTRIYVAEANDGQQPVTMQAGPYAGQTICSGFWAALDPTTAAILWETPVQPVEPANNGTCSYNRSNLSVALGPVSTANGVVYVGDLTGNMHALDASTGTELWSFKGAGSSNAGPAIVNGVLYWGNGYYIGNNSTTFYAFSLGGQ